MALIQWNISVGNNDLVVVLFPPPVLSTTFGVKRAVIETKVDKIIRNFNNDNNSTSTITSTIIVLVLIQYNTEVSYVFPPYTFSSLSFHPPGTLYLLTFDCAKTFSLSNAT